MKDWARMVSRSVLFTSCLLATTLVACGLRLGDTLTGKSLARSPWAQRCFQAINQSLGLEVRVHGKPVKTPTLYVCNHVSWCDIPVLGQIMPVTFLSKSEVRRWPLIGWLAKQAGTVFIERGKGKATSVAETLAGVLENGESVLLFPEGTTTTGLTVLPFHGRLLRSASFAGVRIQPVSLSYRRRGEPDHLTPFINNDDFIAHLGRMLRHPSPEIDVILHPPVEVSASDNLSELAGSLRNIVYSGVVELQNGGRDAQDVISPEGNQQPPLHPSPRAFR